MAAVIRRHPRKLIAAGTLATAVIYSEYLPNPFRTTGVASIEQRYSSAGGSVNHTPASATRRGHHDQIDNTTETKKGMGTPYWHENITSQKPDPSKFDKTWNEAHYNSPKGK